MEVKIEFTIGKKKNIQNNKYSCFIPEYNIYFSSTEDKINHKAKILVKMMINQLVKLNNE